MLRYRITEQLKKKLEPLDYVYAFWYEGADANNLVDEYSDIDYCIDIEDEFEEEAIIAVEQALYEIGKIDYKYVMGQGHPKLRQTIYHIEGTSEYLMIDFNWQLHSRDREESTLIKGDLLETVKVIFDKDNIIRYKQLDLSEHEKYNDNILAESKFRYTQHSRVIKYVYRKQYAEAYAYYNKYVVDPLINILRLNYTPAHADCYLVHISSHMPLEVVRKLENFLKIASLEDIEVNIPLAQKWFEELLIELKITQ
jgi:hypothetical protein